MIWLRKELKLRIWLRIAKHNLLLWLMIFLLIISRSLDSKCTNFSRRNISKFHFFFKIKSNSRMEQFIWISVERILCSLHQEIFREQWESLHHNQMDKKYKVKNNALWYIPTSVRITLMRQELKELLNHGLDKIVMHKRELNLLFLGNPREANLMISSILTKKKKLLRKKKRSSSRQGSKLKFMMKN